MTGNSFPEERYRHDSRREEISSSTATSTTATATTDRVPASPLTILHAEDESVEVNMAQDPSAVEVFLRMIKDKEMELLYQKRQLENLRSEVNILKQRTQTERNPKERQKLIRMSENIANVFVGKKVVFMEQYEQWRGGMVKIYQELQRQGLTVKIPVKYRNQEEEEEESSEEQEESYTDDDDQEDTSESYTEEESTEDASVE